MANPALPAVSREAEWQQWRQTPVGSAIRTVAGQLDDPSFAVRENATRVLTDQSTEIGQLYGLLANGGLTAEQSYRLLDIVRNRLLNAPRGAIGIRMDLGPMIWRGIGGGMGPEAPGENGPIEIRIAELLPGLPAERILQIGDRIVKVDGRDLNSSEDLLNYVQARKPGEKVNLTIRRARVDERGEIVLNQQNLVIFDTMEIQLPLGSADLLRLTPGQAQAAPSLVERERQRLARDAAAEFSPRARGIQIQGQDTVSFGSLRPGAAIESAEPSDPMIDRYWAVQSIMQDRQMIRDGRRQDTPALRNHWNQQLRDLIDLSQRPERLPSEREFLRRVVDRFAQLMSVE